MSCFSGAAWCCGSSGSTVHNLGAAGHHLSELAADFRHQDLEVPAPEGREAGGAGDQDGEPAPTECRGVGLERSTPGCLPGWHICRAPQPPSHNLWTDHAVGRFTDPTAVWDYARVRRRSGTVDAPPSTSNQPGQAGGGTTTTASIQEMALRQGVPGALYVPDHARGSERGEELEC